LQIVKSFFAAVSDISFLLNQSSLIKNFSLNNTFLKNTDGQKILSSALTEAAKEGKFEAFKKAGVVDCLTLFMITSAACYGGYESCLNNNGNNCVLWLMGCFAGMYATYDACHDLEGPQ
jgi:hypothetical protein